MKWNSEYDFVAIITHPHEAFVMQVMIDNNERAKKDIVFAQLDNAAADFRKLQSQFSSDIPERLFFDAADGHLKQEQLNQLAEYGWTQCRTYQLATHPDFPAALQG